MSAMYGADADELDRLAGEFNRAADELDQNAGALTGVLNNVSWLGDTASRFLSDWTGIRLPRIGLSTRFLRETAASLTGHAADQRAASRSNGQLAFAGTPWHLGGAAEQSPPPELLPLIDYLETVEDMTPAEQLAWWDSLTPEQQHGLIAFAPDGLLVLQGLPVDVLSAAENSFLANIAPEVVTGTDSIHGELQASIKIVKVGGEFDVEQTTYADGSVALTFGIGLMGGAGVRLAEALAERGLDGTYRFSSKAEADEFVQGLIDAIKPQGGVDWVIPADNVKDVVAFLYDERDHLESLGFEAGSHVKVDGRAGEVEIGGNLSGEYNLHDATTTLSASGYVSGGLDTPGFSVTGSAEASLAVTIGPSGSLEELTIKLDLDAAVLGGPDAEVLKAQVGPTMSGTATVTFDLTDPDVRAALGSSLDAALRGDVARVVTDLGSAGDLATITVQTSSGVSGEAGFDAVVIEGSITTESTVTAGTWIKPPGRDFVAYTAATGQVGGW